jgi:hypothetical protein
VVVSLPLGTQPTLLLNAAETASAPDQLDIRRSGNWAEFDAVSGAPARGADQKCRPKGRHDSSRCSNALLPVERVFT